MEIAIFPCLATRKSLLYVCQSGGTPERRKEMKNIEIKDKLRRELQGNGGDLMKRYAVCAFLGALLWLPILGGALHA